MTRCRVHLTAWLAAGLVVSTSLVVVSCNSGKRRTRGATTAATTSATTGVSTSGQTTPGTQPPGTQPPGTQPPGTQPPGTQPPGVLDDHGNDPATATQIQVGTPTAGLIEVAGDEDWFRVRLQGGTSYELRAQSSGDTTLFLVDAAGSRIGFNDDEDDQAGLLHSLIQRFPIPSDADYYLVVSDQGSGGTAYDVIVEPSPAAPSTGDDHADGFFEASWIHPGALMAGEIEVSSDQDLFAMFLTAGQTYTFRTETSFWNGDTEVWLFDPYGHDVTYNDNVSGSWNFDLSSEISEWTAPFDGIYFLAVAGSQVNQGTGGRTSPDYEVIYERVGPPAADDHGDHMTAATRVTENSRTQGQIDRRFDEDWFQVDLQSGVSYELRADAPLWNDDTTLSLVDSQGDRIAFNDDVDPQVDYRSAIFRTVPTPGTYYLVVRARRVPRSPTLIPLSRPDYELAVIRH